MKYILLYVLGILLIPFSLRAQEGSYSEPINLGILTPGQIIVDTHNIEGPDDVTAIYSVDYQFEIQESFKVIIRHVEPTSYRSSGIWFDYGNEDSFSFSSVDSLAHFEIELRPGIYRVISFFNTPDTPGTITTSLELKSSSPISQPSPNQNYVLTRTYTNDVGTAWQDKVDYFDGLGRPGQSVLAGASPSRNDLVTLREYDAYGREQKSWLPAVISGNNSAYVSPATIQSESRTSNGNDLNPYSLTEYEASPLNRVLEQYGPGEAWQNNSRSAKIAYLANIADNDTLNCVYYKVEEGTSDTIVSIIRSGNYETAQLYVTRSTDEDGNASFEFKDKQGQVVLIRQIQRIGSAKTTNDTYYIYDDYGNLTAVLPPLASDGMKSGTSWTNANSAILRNYAYLYLYDGRNRCKGKRLPGCSWNYYVYDTGDRLIFSQDGEQRKKGEWGFTLPDIFGRTCATGICKNSFSALAATPPLNNVVVKVTRDNTTDTYKGYTLSGITLVSPTVLNVNYYDDYAFMGKNGIPDSTDTDFRYEPTSGFGIRYEESAKTFLTGTLTARLDGSTTPTYLYSVMYYDYRSRMIQTKSNNHLTGGIEKKYVAYNFTGQPTQKKHIHSATGKTTQTEIYSYNYDHAGRLLTVKHKLDSGTNTGRLITLVKNTYDELGRLKANMKDSLAALTTTYAYNVRSWMKSSSSPLFSQTLYYNDSYGSNTPRYNGNISAMSWTISGDKTRGYNFAYDNLSRLTAAGYLEGGVANSSYSTSYAYDKHGNMTNLIRNGRTGTTTFGTVDNLSMSYAGNQLIKADDAGINVTLSASMDFKNNSTAAKEYHYDKDGNLTKDLNKGIDSIRYNLLNLPQSVTIKNTLGQATNTYTYAADGRKLRTVQQWSSTNSKQTDYVGNVIYESVNGTAATLKRILVDGGYIEGGAYYFYLTDHLGNNRVVANASGGIVQTNHYYPFGMSFAEGVTSSGQPYKYNGKELDTERGLNLYDYSARLMDPALGRFSTMDPLAEKYYSISPYAYVGNNPIRLNDPNGSDWRDRVVGAIVATVDNATGIDLRSTYTPIDASDYNDGQDIGDLASVFIGTGEVDAGGGIASGSVLVTAVTGGFSVEITGPTFALGSAVAGHGAFMATNGTSNFASQKGRVSEENHKKTDKGSLSGTKAAVKEAHDKVGGSLPKGKPGKKGSPQRGDSKKGYRLDPEHPNRTPDDPESGPHINWWDYTKGKRGSGGESGAIPIK